MFKDRIFVTCQPRLSGVLAKEIESHQLKVTRIDKMGVELNGDMKTAMYLNLHLRTGNRVLLLIDEFEAQNADELYKHLVEIPWEEYIDYDSYFCVNSFVRNDTINDTRFPNLKTKDAIVDRIFKMKGKRPNSGPEEDKASIFLRWVDNDCKIFFDTSGATIAKHGYRLDPFKAPLLEALASGLIFSSNWDSTSDHFINPMCGSGTLAIEAALLAINKAPGLIRSNFAFRHFKGYDIMLWHELRKEAMDAIRPFPEKMKIIATDHSRKALAAARANAKKAGVAEYIDFSVCDFKNTFVRHGKGVVFVNPEYGERLGEEEQLMDVYQDLGDFFKQECPGYTGYIFTGNQELAKQVGLKTKSRQAFYNGRIDCRLLEYELYLSSRD